MLPRSIRARPGGGRCPGHRPRLMSQGPAPRQSRRVEGGDVDLGGRRVGGSRPRLTSSSVGAASSTSSARRPSSARGPRRRRCGDVGRSCALTLDCCSSSVVLRLAEGPSIPPVDPYPPDLPAVRASRAIVARPRIGPGRPAAPRAGRSGLPGRSDGGRGVGVDQADQDLAPVAGVDRAGGVHDADAVPGGEPGTRVHEARVALGQRDGHPGAHQPSLPRLEHEVLGGDQVGAGIVGVGVRRCGRARRRGRRSRPRPVARGVGGRSRRPAGRRSARGRSPRPAAVGRRVETIQYGTGSAGSSRVSSTAVFA